MAAGEEPSPEQCSEEISIIPDQVDNENNGHFYSVFIPSDVPPKDTEITKFVFKDKLEALKLVKKTKKARFKQFDNYPEAVGFATAGSLDFSKNNSIKETVSAFGNEKVSPFKGPKPQDLIKLRKGIETGDVDFVKRTIWENPRYLVSNGDTPSILQEGFRYNALHVAAKAKHAMMAELILSTISDTKFIRHLYNGDRHENYDNRVQVLLDLYLNTPDKGLNETPLHFASKFGAAGVVEVLVSFPQCDRNLKNKYGQTADMIICDRCDNKSGISTLKKTIGMHLENSYYVPVLRAEDNSMTPIIGEPFSPGDNPVATKDPLSPRLEIHAYAGPLNKEGAEQFRKIWKTPPRTSTPKKRNDIRYTDPSKGLERVGHQLAFQFDTNWKEYWPFLNCFIDITSNDGLILFEHYLTSRVVAVDGSYASSFDSSPDESSMNSGSLSTIGDLCFHMGNCKIADESLEAKNFTPFLCVEKACNYLANRLATEIYYKYLDDFYIQVNLFELQTKQVELLILSYMDDNRFAKVNFSSMHARVGALTCSKLCFLLDRNCRARFISTVKKFVSKCAKTYDCFSSDDEGNYPKDSKPTSTKKQMICLLQQVINNFIVDAEPEPELDEESTCEDVWKFTKECTCVFHARRMRRGLGIGRSNSAKHRLKCEISKKLFSEHFPDDDRLEGDESDDDFFTPPPSPLKNISSDEEDFQEAPLLSEIFVEGINPTKADYAVFKALKLSDRTINPTEFPNIYRWYHNVNLYTEAERDRWPSPAQKKQKDRDIFTSPCREVSPTVAYTPPSTSWLRITGANSPKSSFSRQKEVLVFAHLDEGTVFVPKESVDFVQLLNSLHE